MSRPAPRRRLRLRPGRRAGGLGPALLALAAALLAALAVAPTALARPGSAAAGLLPTPLPSVCVGGVLLCDGGHPLTQPALPTPCVGGVLLCSPLPSILPSNPVIGPPQPPPASPPVRPGPTPGTPRSTPAAGSPNGGGPGTGGIGGGPVATGPLPAPPGVGLVAVTQPVADEGRAPDSFATVLSLSMRDGLASGRYHVWPWLLGLQLLLWTVLAAAVRFRSDPAEPSRHS